MSTHALVDIGLCVCWAARYDAWHLIKPTSKGVAFPFRLPYVGECSLVHALTWLRQPQLHTRRDATQ